MALSPELIEKLVDSAFKSFEGISEVATLTEQSVSGFDFGSGNNEAIVATSTIKVIPITTKIDSDSTIVTEFLAKRSDFNISNYTTLTINSKEYRIEDQELFEGVIVITARRDINE